MSLPPDRLVVENHSSSEKVVGSATASAELISPSVPSRVAPVPEVPVTGLAACSVVPPEYPPRSSLPEESAATAEPAASSRRQNSDGESAVTAVPYRSVGAGGRPASRPLAV